MGRGEECRWNTNELGVGVVGGGRGTNGLDGAWDGIGTRMRSWGGGGCWGEGEHVCVFLIVGGWVVVGSFFFGGGDRWGEGGGGICMCLWGGGVMCRMFQFMLHYWFMLFIIKYLNYSPLFCLCL